MKLSLMNTNMLILEKEKGRHLEVNAVEKEKYQAQLENLMIQNEESEKIIQNTTGENQALYDKLNKVNLICINECILILTYDINDKFNYYSSLLNFLRIKMKF